MPLVKWKIIFSTFFFLLWREIPHKSPNCSLLEPVRLWHPQLEYVVRLKLYAVLLCLMDVREAWKGGYGRVRTLLGVTHVPPATPALPLLLLPMLACTKTQQLILVTCSLVVIALSTVCVTVTIAVLQERSLQGMETRLLLELQDKYGHGSTNNQSNMIFTQSMDYVQFTFKCCGVTGDADYAMTNWHERASSHGQPRHVPPSCCVPENKASNISHSGTPINVVSRVFYGMLEEGWQNPQPKHESFCQAKESSLYRTARYTQGCKIPIHTTVRRDIVMTMTLDGVLVLLEVIGIILCNILRKEQIVQVVAVRKRSNSQE